MEISTEIKTNLFGQYLGQRINFKIGGIVYDEKLWIKNLEDVCSTYKNSNPKLLLKPLSSITNEDAIEVGKILFGKEYSVGEVYRGNDYEVSVKVLKPDTTINQNATISFKGGLSNCNGWGLQNVLSAYQYLISKGYDLPQFLLDGKTLYEAELAIYEN